MVKLILVLSHYQESTEIGFNINESVNKVNTGQESVIAIRKLIIDHMPKKKDLKIGLSNIGLSSKLIRSVKDLGKKYNKYLDK